jgi:hypothetical protein
VRVLVVALNQQQFCPLSLVSYWLPFKSPYHSKKPLTRMKRPVRGKKENNERDEAFIAELLLVI